MSINLALPPFNNKRISQGGFTLVELLVSLAVLSVGILGVMNLMITSIGIVGDTNKRVVAANLAQEGIEIATYIRSTNWIEGEAYNEGFPPNDRCSDVINLAMAGCGSDPGLKWNGSVYRHNSGTATIFSRTTTITEQTDSSLNPYLRIVTVVTWEEGAHTLTAESNLYDWR